ncbi:isoaspartyl peptidase/L-asparaginase family protein [Rhabdochromatium marinum]|uniref:isoaspartyl peptidase/L-asparaginase family protein n=1 Tax=Rhabdochromatium marinum TaxID=48729 RepID=UPI001904C778|nr:isoaspartyl peptidase/L-asparaginase family protein [Rhabdochromatium marinum]MBK1648619.1 L-asparaginase [Rhabdochromatium marinum]
MTSSYSLMIHGGAGALDNVRDQAIAVRYLESIRLVLEFGREILARGGTAVEAVESCASELEDNPLFNAGCGSVLNEDGQVEMDAGIMDGRDLAAGAVAGVSGIANPVQLARLIMDGSEHVLLCGEGARRYAEYCGVPITPDDYFRTPERIAQLEQAKVHRAIMLDHDESGEAQKYGTIGAVARDLNGNLAAATSTGGIVNKRLGRIGDSCIIGAGVYADNASGAISTTGYGEDFIRTALAKMAGDLIEYRGLDANGAVEFALKHFRRKIGGRGGLICIDHQGQCASAMTTKKMIHGWIEHGGASHCQF